MLVLALADAAILTEDSTFGTLAAHLLRRPRQAVCVVTGAGRCYAIPPGRWVMAGGD